MTKNLLLILILALAIFLRFARLDTVPPGFANDEGAITYQAYSVLKTGKDTWGNKFPLLSFRDFGEHLPPFAVYAQIPFLHFLGLNEFSARVPFALSSVLAMLPLYILTLNLFKKREIAIIACLLYAISPLSIGWSRFVYEGNFGMLFYLTAMMFFVLGKKNINYLLLSLIFFGLTFTTYHIYFFISPITVALLFITKLNYLFTKNKLLLLKLCIVGLIIGAYYILIVASGSGRERFRQVSIFTKESIIQDLNTKKFLCDQQLPNLLCRLTYNKATAYSKEYTFNYLYHFSPVHLGINGTFLRGAILPIHGLIYPFEMIFFFIGVILIALKRQFSSYIVTVWLLLYPAANSFTGVGEISRITHAIPLFSILSAYGIYHVFTVLKKIKYVWVAASIVIIIAIHNVGSFLIDYYFIFPKTNSKNGGFAYVSAIKEIRKQKIESDRIFITRQYLGSAPEFQARIFFPLSPQAFQDKDRNEYLIKKPENYIEYRRIDNYYFDTRSLTNITSRDLLIISPDERLQSDKVELEISEPTKEISLFVVRRQGNEE